MEAVKIGFVFVVLFSLFVLKVYYDVLNLEDPLILNFTDILPRRTDILHNLTPLERFNYFENKTNKHNHFYTGTEEDIRKLCLSWKLNFTTSPLYLRGFSSQWAADSYLYWMIFYHLHHLKGFYLDLAAAFPKSLSNTFFFDKCLGWNGLCIEGDPLKAEIFKDSVRTCQFENACVYKENITLSFVAGIQVGTNSIIEDKEKKTSRRGKIIDVPCVTLDSILKKHKVKFLDFMSLDVEEYEYEALVTADFNETKIDLILIEANGGFVKKEINQLLTQAGFTNLGSMGKVSRADFLFIRNRSIWYQRCEWKKGLMVLTSENYASASPPIMTNCRNLDLNSRHMY